MPGSHLGGLARLSGEQFAALFILQGGLGYRQFFGRLLGRQAQLFQAGGIGAWCQSRLGFKPQLAAQPGLIGLLLCGRGLVELGQVGAHRPGLGIGVQAGAGGHGCLMLFGVACLQALQFGQPLEDPAPFLQAPRLLAGAGLLVAQCRRFIG